MIRYSGENYLVSIPTHDELVAKNDEGSIVIHKNVISKHQGILFMPLDIEESKKYINQIPYYIFCLYGYLVNGQKVIITITGIKVFLIFVFLTI